VAGIYQPKVLHWTTYTATNRFSVTVFCYSSAVQYSHTVIMRGHMDKRSDI